VLVVEYLPGFRTVDALAVDRLGALAPDVFRALREIHDAGMAHGDIRAENVLVLDGAVYFIDATNVRDDPVALADAAAYDLACTAATLAARVGARATVAAALEVVSPAELLEAREFLDFVNMRPDHDFDAAALRSEIDSAAD
jgi:tRNA A-37 threonylcarbamoyl transferase component Bud32